MFKVLISSHAAPGGGQPRRVFAMAAVPRMGERIRLSSDGGPYLVEVVGLTWTPEEEFVAQLDVG